MTILQPAEYGCPEDHLSPFYMAGVPGIIRTNITWWLVFPWKKSPYLMDAASLKPAALVAVRISFHLITPKKDAEAIFNSGSLTVNGRRDL
jgi:hypothetical protein